jgi:hypothetical protein
MDFWNDNTMFVTQKNVKVASKKKSSKKKIISEMHWNFPNIYIFKFNKF